MKILVTGHKGFIGTYLYAELVAQGHSVYGMDRQQYPSDDIMMVSLEDYERVYHLAAKTDARGESATEMAQTNIMGSLRLFEKYGDRLVFASSCAIHYDTPYGLSKRAAEDYARLFGCGVVRLCNIHGYGGHSVIDIFRRSEELPIAGVGTQLRTYAPVEAAIKAFLACQPGELVVLSGTEATVQELANAYPKKRRIVKPRGKWDIEVGVQR